MLIKIIIILLMINISFNQECPDLIEFFNSNQLKELIENIELDKQLQTDYQCNFLAYQVCVMLDRLDEAKKFIEQTILIEDNTNYRMEAEKLTKTIRELKSVSYTLENGNLDDAINEYQDKINDSNLLQVSLFHKGLAIAYKKKFYELEKKSSLDPENYYQYLDLSNTFFKKGLEINPHSDYENEILNISKYLTNLGKEAMKSEEYNSSLEHFIKAIEYSPNYALSYFYKGNLYMKLQDYEQAANSYENGLSSYTNIEKANYKVLYLAGTCYEKLGVFNKAKKYFKYAIGNNNTYTKARFALSNVYYKEQNFNLAKENLFKILKYDSSYIKAYELLVNIFLDLNDLINAKKYCLEGIENDSKSYSLFSKLAFLNNESQLYEQAIEESQKSLSFKKNYGPALIELGRAYTYLCNKVAAEDAFKKSRKFDRRMSNQLLDWSKEHVKTVCSK